MRHFPVEVPKSQTIKTLERLGFRVIREGNHISMIRENPDGSRTPLTMPNHRRIKGSTLRRICNQSGISRTDFLEAYSQV
jgi:predicted RNA binding protein YcfA (HicA-like mRNA interferase family)